MSKTTGEVILELSRSIYKLEDRCETLEASVSDIEDDHLKSLESRIDDLGHVLMRQQERIETLEKTIEGFKNLEKMRWQKTWDAFVKPKEKS